jgi:uncharacterized membrane protein YdjX (TVP38/TMEM64 family)
MSIIDTHRTGGGVGRWIPVIVIVLLTALVIAMGWHRYLSLKTIGLNYEALENAVSRNVASALALYSLLYTAMVALSLPGALVLTLTGGLLFGWQLGALATALSATLGATLVFLVARSSFGEVLARKAGPWLAKLRGGFRENAISYLLFLRLVPAFPFWLVNLAPALLGVPLRTFLVGTFFGIIPGTIAYSVAGAGLASVIEAQNAVYRACLARAASSPGLVCEYRIDTTALVTKELLLAFALLGVVALIPVACKKWSKRHATA